MGQASGVAVDDRDHVFVLQRPRSLTDDEKAATFKPPRTRCCVPAPPVLEFDADGQLVRAWGGPGQGYDWPETEHGINIDHKGFVWIGGNGPRDGHVLKFTREGRFVLQIGKPGPQTTSGDLTRLGRPADTEVDPQTNEVYVADGYHNHRVIVFDADTGAYKRHWGAYGTRTPTDDKLPNYDPNAPLSKSFGNPVHCVRVSNDNLVYVCDRQNNRVQVFSRDGEFKHEFRVEVQTLANGSVWDMVLSHDPAQRYLYVADGANGRIYILHILRRSDGRELGSFGRTGRMPGEFKWIHNIAIDRDGNLFTSEVGFGRRVQKFVRTGGAF